MKPRERRVSGWSCPQTRDTPNVPKDAVPQEKVPLPPAEEDAPWPPTAVTGSSTICPCPVFFDWKRKRKKNLVELLLVERKLRLKQICRRTGDSVPLETVCHPVAWSPGVRSIYEEDFVNVDPRLFSVTVRVESEGIGGARQTASFGERVARVYGYPGLWSTSLWRDQSSRRISKRPWIPSGRSSGASSSTRRVSRRGEIDGEVTVPTRGIVRIVAGTGVRESTERLTECVRKEEEEKEEVF